MPQPLCKKPDTKAVYVCNHSTGGTDVLAPQSLVACQYHPINEPQVQRETLSQEIKMQSD